MSDVPTATKIAALEEHVRQLTADAAAFNSILKRGQEWMNSAHDSWQRMCNQREEAREALTKALADNATLNTAKDRLIDERNACLRELDAARQELSDRNAYAERLLAENVRLTNEAAEVREDLANAQTWIGGQDTFSDLRNAGEMRWALVQEREKSASLSRSITAACTGSGCLNAHELRQAIDRERERCGVLEAEVKAWHAAEHLRKDEPHAEFMRLAEARALTRETHALDAAKFGKEQK